MSDPDQAIEATFGRYVLLKPLGEGGMGMVFVAYDPYLNRKVALKFVHSSRTEGGTADPMFQARFVREARSLARLSHPNIVAIFDFGLQDERAYLTMELVDGCTLKHWLRQPQVKRTWQEVVAVFVAAGQGLIAAHAAGLVHRDIKPDNILIGQDGSVRLADFGIAGERNETAGDKGSRRPANETSNPQFLTQVGDVIGTPLYMSPEQSRGDPVDGRSDEFSLCLVFFEALYGHLPHVGSKYPSYAQACNAGGVALPSWPKLHRHPEWLDELLQRGLSARADDRFATVDEMLVLLQSHHGSGKERLQVGAIAASFVIGLGLAVAAVTQAPEDTLASCRLAADKWAEVWGEAQVEALSQHMRDQGPTGTRMAWKEVQAQIFAYNEQWTALHHQLCESNRGDDRSTKAADAQLACLDRHFLHFKGMVSQWQSDRKFSPFIALSQVQKLPEVALCEDYVRLNKQIPLPEDPWARQEVLRLREALVQIENKEILRDPTGQAEFHDIYQQAQDIGDFALLADVHMVHAVAEKGHGEHRAALHGLQMSFLNAVAGKYYPGAAFAALLRTFIDAYLLGNLNQVDERIAHITSIVRAAGDPIELRGNVSNLHAILLVLTGREEEAISELWRTLEICEKDRDMAAAALLTDSLALTYKSLNRFEEAYASGQRAFRWGLYFLPMGNHLRTNFQANLAEYLSDLGRYEQALVDLDEARERYSQEATEIVPIWMLSIKTEALIRLGRYPEAVREIEDIRDRQRSQTGRGHPIVEWADVYDAWIWLELRPDAKALSLAQAGVRQTLDDPSTEGASRALALRIRGEIELEEQALQQAERTLADALALTDLKHGRSRLERGEVLRVQAQIKLAQHDVAAAERAIEQAYAIVRPDYGQTNSNLAPFELVRAQVFRQRGMLERAQESLTQVHRLLGPGLEPDSLAWLPYAREKVKLITQTGDQAELASAQQRLSDLENLRKQTIALLGAEPAI